MSDQKRMTAERLDRLAALAAAVLQCQTGHPRGHWVQPVLASISGQVANLIDRTMPPADDEPGGMSPPSGQAWLHEREGGRDFEHDPPPDE